MLKFEGFEFDPKSGRLKNLTQDTEVHLRQKLVALLAHLHSHQQRVVSKQELLDTLWEHGQYREKSLSQSILELRKALGDSASEPKYIRTLPNQGYQWIAADVSELDVSLTSSKETSNEDNLLDTDEPLRFSSFIRIPHILVAFLLLVMLGITAYFVLFEKRGETKLQASAEPYKASRNGITKVIILPFKNATGTQVMNWVEYGLSEMLTYDLSLIDSIEVIAPTQIRTPLNLKDNSAWSADLMAKYQADMVLTAAISLEKEEQVLSYQLITAEGEQEGKQIKRLDLAVAMPDVASEIFREIRPNSQLTELDAYTYVPSAMHDFARGLQALQTDGYVLAQYYFKASMQIDKSHTWSVLYQAISQYQLGEWQAAEAVFRELVNNNKEAAILESAHFWLALIHYRQGELEQAQAELDTSQSFYVANQQDLVQSLRSQLQHRIDKLRSNRLMAKDNIVLSASDEDVSSLKGPLLDVPLFNHDKLIALLADKPQTSLEYAEFEALSRELTLKGHKPVLFRLLLKQSLKPSLTWVVRDNLAARTIDIISELEQPYDLAIAWLIRGRLAMAMQNNKAAMYLSHAKEIATGLEAKLLIREIETYVLLNEAQFGKSRIEKSVLLERLKALQENLSQDQLSLLKPLSN
ncbi:winged helix-turn-helix domain-containing protein [Marinomonas sp. PE14-40]|uniref:winged helix-turn-helix domain-containing protein n=1 Tax=Marinomonas sp. PE14-40 TaxID=3060621 RepID=UPI003F676160